MNLLCARRYEPIERRQTIDYPWTKTCSRSSRGRAVGLLRLAEATSYRSPLLCAFELRRSLVLIVGSCAWQVEPFTGSMQLLRVCSAEHRRSFCDVFERCRLTWFYEGEDVCSHCFSCVYLRNLKHEGDFGRARMSFDSSRLPIHLCAPLREPHCVRRPSTPPPCSCAR